MEVGGPAPLLTLITRVSFLLGSFPLIPHYFSHVGARQNTGSSVDTAPHNCLPSVLLSTYEANKPLQKELYEI